MHVALLANLQKNSPYLPGMPPDMWNDLDSEATIDSITAALDSRGHKVTFLEGNNTLLDNLRKLKPDICFNICEGHFGDSRTAQVPAILDMLRIPYTGSGVVAQACSLNKAVTKMIWLHHNLPTTQFCEASSTTQLHEVRLNYPMFVKPIREGTGIGVSQVSIVNNFHELHNQVAKIVSVYKQPALIEPFLKGHEYTIGVVGNKPTQYVLPPIEIELDYLEDDLGVYGAKLKTTEKVMKPAVLDPIFCRQLQEIALAAHNSLCALDVSRVDIRCNQDNQPYLMEINLTPGLSQGFSDLAVAAESVKSYEWLINTILDLACKRYGIYSSDLDLPELFINLTLDNQK